MAIIRNATRAFMAVAALLAVFHGIMLVIGVATYLTDNSQPPSPDQVLKVLAARVACDVLLFAACHALLRNYRLATRAAYGAAGGVAAGLGYAIAVSQKLYITPPIEGTILTAAILPVMVGMIAGVTYVKLAGREIVAAPPSTAENDVAPAPAPATFDGPIQVRTSYTAIAVAAAVPAAIVALATLPFVTSILSLFDNQAVQQINWSKQMNELALPAYFFIVALLATGTPSAVVIGITHLIARSLKKTNGLQYAGIGAAVAVSGALFISPFMSLWLTFPAAMIVGAATGATYRWFAGIEPLALPESVLATDRATLVDANHPSRHTRGVIMNG